MGARLLCINWVEPELLDGRLDVLVLVKWRAKGRFVIGSHGRPLITRGTAVLVAAELAWATFV